MKEYENMMIRNSDDEFELDSAETYGDRKKRGSLNKKIVEQDQNSTFDEFYDAICKLIITFSIFRKKSEIDKI